MQAAGCGTSVVATNLARGLLAQKARVTVHQLEAGVGQPRQATLEVIRRALESAGVEFINENGGGPGVRLIKRQRLKRSK